MDKSGKKILKTKPRLKRTIIVSLTFFFFAGGGRFDPIFLNILFFPRLKKDLKDVYSVKEELF